MLNQESTRTENSEVLFERYLRENKYSYEPHHPVGGGNVDFKVNSKGSAVLCDVKEVRDSAEDSGAGFARLDAHKHIRGDVRKLRQKFKDERPAFPVVLVTMNFSSRFFTGLTVARALLGDAGKFVDRGTLEPVSPFQHLPRGNAAMTEQHNRSISGVLVFDWNHENHRLFVNPFTDKEIPSRFFPEIQEIKIDRNASEGDLRNLAEIMFWPKTFRRNQHLEK